jgi:hypothetical protein
MQSSRSTTALPSSWGVGRHVRLHVLKVVNIKFVIVWDVIAFSLIGSKNSLGKTCFLYFHGIK